MSIHEFYAKLNEEATASPMSPMMDALRKIRHLDHEALTVAASSPQWADWPPVAESAS
jgi:hypothetical protein